MDVTRIKIKKGLDVPLAGAPQQIIEAAVPVSCVALIGADYIDMKPSMLVEQGDRVKLGQPLFEDKRNPGVLFTAPAAGIVSAINRGARRVLQSVVIEVDGDEAIDFGSHAVSALPQLARETVRDQLVQSGLWTALRTRPYNKTPAIDAVPAAIFVSALDTNPLAADPAVVLAERAEDFKNGLAVLSRLTEGELFVCKAPGSSIPLPELPSLRVAEFEGPHPAGLVGTHMHFLKPVGATRSNWHIGPQDVVAIGQLFTTGRLSVERVISLAGPVVRKPRLLRTRVGASVDQLLKGELEDIDARAISGSVLGGRRAAGWAAYLGRFDVQVSVIVENRDRELFGWLNPAGDKYSVTNVFFSALSKASRRFSFSTSTNGSPRAMVPIGSYERVVPLDILPTQLLRALLVRDTDMAQSLGALELAEEDLSLCTYVCVGKYDYAPMLRANLDQIEKEG
ncbi:Na(+)-translocating NADH-quinone reductase subunit A [Algiphilus sp. W345]|uniref:Na(+)-translocating NADH-quinone reductase subunit A n=1 Tax=Banduia mediterranea TaxID=3075609 RepID=A0ABU2WJY7_9GAMM|nr:Na(+)-translocating NADH-quinone reductase subunit A [Algiphilus sp. W345]MDT0497848.1 Na(+)-translocating NADH-quinone reductase subunit A [Algiphilus sp. W345]